jgi:hypothetical protein
MAAGLVLFLAVWAILFFLTLADDIASGAWVAVFLASLNAALVLWPRRVPDCRLPLCNWHRRITGAWPWLFALSVLVAVVGAGLSLLGRWEWVWTLLPVGVALASWAHRLRWPVHFAPFEKGPSMLVVGLSGTYVAALKQQELLGTSASEFGEGNLAEPTSRPTVANEGGRPSIAHRADVAAER